MQFLLEKKSEHVEVVWNKSRKEKLLAIALSINIFGVHPFRLFLCSFKKFIVFV